MRDRSLDAPAGWSHREQLRVRYQEVDQQNVVFNSHYLGWCDIAFAAWMRAALGWTGVDDDVDWMLVRAEIEWQGSAGYGDDIDIDCRIGRWGRTSFDTEYRGTVDGRATFTATITYVSVKPGTTDTTPVTDDIRAALSSGP